LEGSFSFDASDGEAGKQAALESSPGVSANFRFPLAIGMPEASTYRLAFKNSS
jgi:hypothetical protein